MRPMLRGGASAMGSVLHPGPLRPFWRLLQQPDPVLELGDAELEILVVVAGDEPELAEDRLERCAGLLPHAGRVAAPPRREILDQRLRLVALREATVGELLGQRVRALGGQRDGADGREDDALGELAPGCVGAIWLVHAGGPAACGGAARAWSRRRPVPASSPSGRRAAAGPAPARPRQRRLRPPPRSSRRRPRALRRRRGASSAPTRARAPSTS